MFKRMKRDIQAVLDRDPAAFSPWEVFWCSPGLHAIWGHRLAHWFYRHRHPVFARWLAHLNRFFTGIEIHPGAQIGDGLFIDHGMGLVIGETAEISENVTLYKGVVLGGTGKECGKRHPTLGHNVVVSSNAIVLGSITIGNNVKIGAGSVVLNDIPDNCTVVGVPGRIVVQDGSKVDYSDGVEDGGLADPVFEKIEELGAKVAYLERQLKENAHGSENL